MLSYVTQFEMNMSHMPCDVCTMKKMYVGLLGLWLDDTWSICWYVDFSPDEVVLGEGGFMKGLSAKVDYICG